jgi:hypothetical protein
MLALCMRLKYTTSLAMLSIKGILSGMYQLTVLRRPGRKLWRTSKAVPAEGQSDLANRRLLKDPTQIAEWKATFILYGWGGLPTNNKYFHRVHSLQGSTDFWKFKMEPSWGEMWATLETYLPGIIESGWYGQPLMENSSHKVKNSTEFLHVRITMA